MEILTSLVDWSRAQFALTACYHWLFVPLTLGLAVVCGIMETLYYKKKDEIWKRAAQFWMKLFGINFAIGVATGLILEFEFGTNWSNYSWFVGDIFGAPLAIEGIVAFFMEATFIAVMFFGWNKVSRGFHLASTWLTGLGATISAWWILVANSWMQHPVGMAFNPDTMRNEMVSFADVALSSTAVIKFFHTVSSGWFTGAVFTVAVGCWFLLRKRNLELAHRSVKVGVIFALFSAVVVMATGDQSGVDISKHQPMKLAAAEGLEKGSTMAPFSIVPGVEVPGVLSLLAKHDPNAFVPGFEDLLNGYVDANGDTILSADEKMARGRLALEAFKRYRELAPTDSAAAAAEKAVLMDNIQYFGYGHLSDKSQLIPPVGITFWSFRLMIGLGCLIALVMALVWWFERKGRLAQMRWLLLAAVWMVPCVYLASQFGWAVAEVGRQPWIIQDMMPVSVATSALQTSSVVITFCLFAVLFTLLLVAEISIMLRAIRNEKFDENPEA